MMMIQSRRLSVVILLLLQWTTSWTSVVVMAYMEEDEEQEDKELTAKLWKLVDQIDQEAQSQSSTTSSSTNKPSFSERTKQGSIGYFSPDGKCQAEEDGQVCSSDSEDEEDVDVEACVDLRPDCDKIARIGDCLYDFESEDCARTCLLCRSPENKTFAIGRPQNMAENFIKGVLDDIEDLMEEWEGADLSALKLDVPFENDDEFLEAVAHQIIGTQKYMSEIVMEDPEYENVRRSCQNYMGHCEIYAAMGYCDNNFMAGQDFLEIRQKCAPACRSCEDYALLHACNPNYDHNFLHEGELDTVFRRMAGELDDGTSKKSPYKVSVHSRPGGDPKTNYVKDGKLLKSNGAVDGAWLITLEDFLTPEECDRMIELGALEGYGRSGLQEDKDDKRKHRTSVNAWCSAEHCDKDPIAQRVVERISNTTGMPPAYSEPLQLLKYTEGQYYKMHHDVDVPKEQYWPHGPRVMTFFLYLNEVEEGGATRMNDVTNKDNDAAPGDYIDDCLEEAETPEDKASCALIEMDIQPKRGMALVWPNLLDSNMKQKDPGTWHEARPVIKGVKYGANAWFRLRRFQRECQSEDYEKWLDSYNMTYSYDDDHHDEESVLVMQTLEDGATSNTKVESKKETSEGDGENDDDKGNSKTTTITTTTTTVNKTPTTITTTTTKVITTTTVTKVEEESSKKDGEEDNNNDKDNDDASSDDEEGDSDDDDDESDSEDSADEGEGEDWPSAL